MPNQRATTIERRLDRTPLSVRAAYVHVPFCRHRCGYCNFTVVADRSDLVPRYLAALQRELSALDEPRPVETLFLGGGTPTELDPPDLRNLLELVNDWFPAAHDRGDAPREFTVEANPPDLTREKLELLATAGVNRVSIGAQSFSEAKLALLERDHSPRDIEDAVRRSRQFMDTLAIDLIFGTPGETLRGWQEDLRRALALAPDHVSTYGLTIERGTRFFNRRLHGRLSEVDEETSRSLFAAAIDTLVAAGFEHYEISNFARPGRRCRHNETYWTGGEYFAVGPGAARHLAGRRETNHRSTFTYLDRVLADRSPVAESEHLSDRARALERLVFGLRRIEGVERAAFAEQTAWPLDRLAGDAITHLVELGLLADDGRRVRLTREGLFLADAVCSRILRD